MFTKVAPLKMSWRYSKLHSPEVCHDDSPLDKGEQTEAEAARYWGNLEPRNCAPNSIENRYRNRITLRKECNKSKALVWSFIPDIQ
jgi:hypothetical protein